MDPALLPSRGRDLCSLSREEFVSRAGQAGELLHTHLAILRGQTVEPCHTSFTSTYRSHTPSGSGSEPATPGRDTPLSDLNTPPPSNSSQGKYLLQDYFLRMRLQRRLYGIYIVCFLIFMIPCNYKLLSFFVNSLNKSFKGRRLNFNLEKSYLTSFKPSLKSHSLWVTLYIVIISTKLLLCGIAGTTFSPPNPSFLHKRSL